METCMKPDIPAFAACLRTYAAGQGFSAFIGVELDNLQTVRSTFQ
jgi:hypothetical protein